MSRRSSGQPGRRRAGGRRAQTGASSPRAGRLAPGPSSPRGSPRPGSSHPAGAQLLGAIDVGSRALRLAIGEVTGAGTIRVLEMLEAPVAIGLDTFAEGRIRSATTDAVIGTLREFVEVLRSYGLDPASCRAVATTAVREARNRDVFLDWVEHGCGLRVEPIEPIEETRLAYQLVRYLGGPGLGQGTSMLLSLGAGGTQLVIERQGDVVLAETRQFGTLWLRESHPGERAAVLAARAFLRKVVCSIRRYQDISQVSRLIVVSKELYGLLEAMARVAPTRAGIQVSRQELVKLHRALASATADDVIAATGLDYAAAEMAHIALEELRAFSDVTAAAEVTVLGASMIDSLLLDARLRLERPGGGGPQAAEALLEQTESASLALGRRYGFDEAHALKVRELAMQLFDALLGYTHLSQRARLLLSVAAMLHDIGYFVSHHDHEKHSAYLVAASELFGLRRLDRDRIAFAIRSHRGPFAEGALEELAPLPAAERIELLKVTALLRLADALDNDHQQRVERVRLSVSGDELALLAETRGAEREAFSTIERSFAAKADLFEELFGLRPRLAEVLAVR